MDAFPPFERKNVENWVRLLRDTTTPSTFCDAFTRELTRKPDCERRFAMSFATAALNGGHTMTCSGCKVTDAFVLNDAWDWEDKWTVVVIEI